MSIVCFIEYRLDPFRLADFERYAEEWGRIIPACGGDLIGYFMPHEGTNTIAWALIGFKTLADYEAYRARLKSDPNGVANFEFARDGHFILEEKRTFLRTVPATFRAGARP